MKIQQMGRAGAWLGVAMLIGAAPLAAADPPVNKTSVTHKADEPQQVARVFKEIKTDAIHVRSAAVDLEKLTSSASPKWLDYDRQWNEIKPAVEDMQIKLWRLEAMREALPPAERNELDQYKQFIQELQNRTAQLRALLDEPGVNLSDAKFKGHARRLAGEADKIQKAPAVS